MKTRNSLMVLDDLFPELLQAILVHAYYEDRTVFPVTACSVSRKWRTTSLETPDLWTLISLSFEDYRVPEHALEQMELWIIRSCNLPIDVEIRGLYRQDFWVNLVFFDHLKLILQATVDRWRSFRLPQSPRNLSTALVQLLRESGALNLQILEIDTIDITTEVRTRCELFEHTPKELSIILCPNLALTLSLVQSLVNLERLELHRDSFDSSHVTAANEVISSLAALSKLEYLAIRNIRLDPPNTHFSAASSDSSNSFLHTIEPLSTLQVDDLELIEPFLALAHFPKLRIVSRLRPIFISSSSLQFNGRLPRLEHLHLDGMSDHLSDLRGLRDISQLLSHQYFLTALTLERFRFSDDSSLKAIGTTCISLRRLVILDCWIPSPTVLKDIVSDRTKKGWPPMMYLEIQRLRVHDLRAMADVRAWLQQHVWQLRWY
jgi:hypothetical protein